MRGGGRSCRLHTRPRTASPTECPADGIPSWERRARLTGANDFPRPREQHPHPYAAPETSGGPCRGGISSARRTKIRLHAQKEPFCRIGSSAQQKIPHRDKAVTPGIEGRAGWLHWVKRTGRDNVNYAGTARAKHPHSFALHALVIFWGRLPEVVRRTASLRNCIPACHTRSSFILDLLGTALTLIYKSDGM